MLHNYIGTPRILVPTAQQPRSLKNFNEIHTNATSKMASTVEAFEREYKGVIDDCLACLGLTELKPEQQEAVQLLLRGKNVFVTLPTGYGKSAIYQVLPLCTKSLSSTSTTSWATGKSAVLVISPLTSLMRDV